MYEFSHLELFNFNLEFTSLIIYTKNTNILLRKDESIMELKNLLESTEVCPDDLSEKQIKKLKKLQYLENILNTAKECILSGNKFGIFSSDYNAEIISDTFINSFDSNYNVRKDPCLLEYKHIPFSSFIIFHIADIRIGNISIANVNPDCVYSCYLYLPFSKSAEQAVIILKDSDNISENLKNIIFRNSGYKLEYGIENINDVLKLCADSFKDAPQPTDYLNKRAFFDTYKQKLLFRTYTINYTETAYKKIYSDHAVKLAVEAIKNNSVPFLSIQEKTNESSLYNEINKLLDFSGAQNMPVIFGYYLYSIFHFKREACPDSSYITLLDKHQFVLHISSPSKSTHKNEVLPLLKKMNKIFFGNKLNSYEYPDEDIDYPPEYTIDSPVCIITNNIKELYFDKAFKDMKKDYPTIVLTKSNKGIKPDQLILEIKKANDLSSVTKKKNYTILSKVVTNFYEYVYSSSDSLVISLASQNTKCDKDKFLKKLFKEYYEEASDKTTYCENEKLAVLFFFVYYFLKFCLRENLLTLAHANALNKKLFEHYFRKSIMYFTNNDEPDCNPVSKDEVIDVIIAMLKDKYDSIPNQRPENGTPCKINTRNSKECIVFRKDKFLNEFADWLEKGYPEEAANIDLVRKYISQTDDSHNIIRKAMYEKNLLYTTSGKNYYKLSNVSYVAFLSDKVLKNDLCLEI